MRDFSSWVSHSGLHSRQGTIGWVRQIHKRHLENEIMLRVWAPMRSTTTAAAVSLLDFSERGKKEASRQKKHTHKRPDILLAHNFSEHTIYTH